MIFTETVTRISIILLLSHLLSLHTVAQQNNSFRVNSVNGDSARFYRSFYRYPQFIQGFILLKNKNTASALVDYNQLSGQMLFINTKGDTLEISNPENISYVAILNDTFYYFDKSYIERISHYDGVNLFKKETIQYNGRERKGAYGGYSKTAAANAIDKVPDENGIKRIGVDENTLYAISTHYYLSNVPGNLVPAVKRNFKKLFPKKGEELNEYLSKNKVNYNSGKDLFNLIEFLQN